MPALASVAGDAGANHIVPNMLSAAPARDNVIQRKLLGLPTTILASVPVTGEHLGPAQFPLVTRAADHINKPDY